MPQMTCPHCSERFPETKPLIGWRVRCPKCAKTFVSAQLPSTNWVAVVFGLVVMFGSFFGGQDAKTAAWAVGVLCGLLICYGSLLGGHLARIEYYLNRADDAAKADERQNG